MTKLFRQVRRHFYPRAGYPARGPGGSMRASDIILCFTVMMLSVALLAAAVIHLFAT